jgi:hypothetical protein
MLRGLRARFFNEKRAKRRTIFLIAQQIGVAARHHSPMRVNGHHGHSASGKASVARTMISFMGGSLPVVELNRAPDWTAML